MAGLPCMGNSIRSWGRGESGGPRPLARGPQELVSLNEREHPVPLKCINDHGGRQPAQEGVTSRRHQSDDEDASVVAASTQSAKAQAAHSDDAGLWRDDAIVGRPPDRVARHLFFLISGCYIRDINISRGPRSTGRGDERNEGN